MNATRLIAAKERQALLRDQRGLGWLLAFSGVLSAFALLFSASPLLTVPPTAMRGPSTPAPRRSSTSPPSRWSSRAASCPWPLACLS